MKRNVSFVMVAAMIIISAMVFGTGCGTLGIKPGGDTQQTFDQRTKAIYDKAIADYNNSVITYQQREAIRSLVCDLQADHNTKVLAGASDEQLESEFKDFKSKVDKVYGRE